LSEEQGERFHQDMMMMEEIKKVMEERYQGRWDRHMMADYCWSIQRDCPDDPHKRIRTNSVFLSINVSV
jgi:hypothetical protein